LLIVSPFEGCHRLNVSGQGYFNVAKTIDESFMNEIVVVFVAWTGCDAVVNLSLINTTEG